MTKPNSDCHTTICPADKAGGGRAGAPPGGRPAAALICADQYLAACSGRYPCCCRRPALRPGGGAGRSGPCATPRKGRGKCMTLGQDSPVRGVFFSTSALPVDETFESKFLSRRLTRFSPAPLRSRLSSRRRSRFGPSIVFGFDLAPTHDFGFDPSLARPPAQQVALIL
ncbi:hypothetical protein EVAR_95348_1 [Eumeta japonica]|uniref:Uncharacterized protein n=1 Tax=Eumeta variegata TaxID=151549 RepID=A0A4C1U9H2_EUMVA|nr:hypothetical protein EVAR_95348_1 [Eumeta japonica]